MLVFFHRLVYMVSVTIRTEVIVGFIASVRLFQINVQLIFANDKKWKKLLRYK